MLKNKIQKTKKRGIYRDGFKILFENLAQYKTTLILLSVLSVFSAVTNAIVPYIAGRLIDSLIAGETVFFIIIGWWIFVKIIADTTDWQIGTRSAVFEERSHMEYVNNGVSKLIDLPMSFHKNRKTGAIFERINRAGGQMSQITSRIIVRLAPQFLSIIFALIITLQINKELTFILMGGIALYILIISRTSPKLVKLHRILNNTYEKAYTHMYEIVGTVDIVKQNTSESHEKRKMFRNLVIGGVRAWQNITNIWQNLSFFQKLIISSVQLIIFIYSFFLISAGKLTVGELVMFNGYTAMAFGPFVSLGHNWQLLQRGFTSLIKMKKILDQPSEIYLPKNPIILKGIDGSVEFKNVNFSYKGKGQQILKEINFQAREGETIALVGESGVGKTTLIELISLYFRPTKGQILIDGHDTTRMDLKFLRSNIAVVPQEIALFNGTVMHNIRYGQFGASEDKVIEAAKLAHADEFIQKFPKKYDQTVGERGIKLSVGQKQRIAIARAILKDPKILILDEPTSALDAKSEKLIQESLDKLIQNKTVFIIAHRLSTVRKADKILVIEKGRIVETGNHESLLKKSDGAYKKLYEMQIGLT